MTLRFKDFLAPKIPYTSFRGSKTMKEFFMVMRWWESWDYPELRIFKGPRLLT